MQALSSSRVVVASHELYFFYYYVDSFLAFSISNTSHTKATVVPVL